MALHLMLIDQGIKSLTWSVMQKILTMHEKSCNNRPISDFEWHEM